MQQGFWYGNCQAKNKHGYYQIRGDGRIVKVSWTPPEFDTAMIANAILVCGGSSNDAATTPASKKMKLSITSTGMQVTQSMNRGNKFG